jgi:predicted NAD-dependent protein-ADP-ribosyltransferase YbiA (DUF1768 family)
MDSIWVWNRWVSVAHAEQYMMAKKALLFKDFDIVR